MKFTTTLTTLTAAAVLLATPLTVFAQTVTPGANLEARLTKLHTECDTEVDKRITSLTSVQARINELQKLSSDQKNTFISEITTDSNGLTALKAKCDSDTDLTTLRNDYRSVFTTYRIFAVFLPQLHLLAAVDTMGVTADKLSDLANKLQIRIQNAGNPSNLTSLLSDMQAKIADAKTQYTNAESQVTSLTPQSYNTDPAGTKQALTTARTDIKTGAQDLRDAFADAKQIVQALKALHTPVSPTVTQ